MSSVNTVDEMIRLRVAGIGHDLQFSMNSNATIGDVKTKVATDTLSLLPPQYILLLCRGKKLTDDTATLAGLKIQDRTRLMLLHSQEYGRDKIGIESIQTIMKELEEEEEKLLNDNDANKEQAEMLDEMVTRACMKLDEIDVSGSDTLRAMRKDALKRAENMASTACAAAEADKEGTTQQAEDHDVDDD